MSSRQLDVGFWGKNLRDEELEKLAGRSRTARDEEGSRGNSGARGSGLWEHDSCRRRWAPCGHSVWTQRRRVVTDKSDVFALFTLNTSRDKANSE